MSRRFYVAALGLLQIVALVYATGRYSVIGPGTIRSNFKYNVAVTLHKAEGPCKIDVGITGRSYNETKSVELQPMSTENVEFNVPALKEGDYNLTAKGVSGITFENSTKLNYADYKPATYIQTDKATYKPGDLVQFRVLILDENTRPAKIEKPITIGINDGAQNRIKQFKDVKLTKGVFTGEFQLSEQPVLGNWNIEVNIAGQPAETKAFEVAKYVLPKFEVSVETAKDVAIADGVIKVTVRAKYTYGKAVKGKASVSIKPIHHYYGSGSDMEANKTIDVDGKGHVEFDLTKDFGLDKERFYFPPLKVLAIMEEELTGNKQNATGTVILHAERYRIEGVNVPYHYEPSKPITVTIVVKNVDGSPVRDSKNKAKLIVDPPRDYIYRSFISDSNDETTTEKPNVKSLQLESNLDEHGMATFEFMLPDTNRYYSVKCTFMDTTTYLNSITKFTPAIEAKEALKLKVLSEKPRLGKPVSVQVKSSDDIPYYVYAVVARGNILKSEYVKVPEGSKSDIIKFMPTFEMIPKATIYVYYVFDNNLRFDEETINFEKEFENTIDITAPHQAKPGEEVQLEIATDSDSFVGLLGVDQSVLLLKSGNDINKDDVFNTLSNYDASTPNQHGYGTYPGMEAGVVTLTNAHYPYDDRHLLDDIELESFSLDELDSFDRSYDESAPTYTTFETTPKVRKDFNEIWIWNQTEGVSNRARSGADPIFLEAQPRVLASSIMGSGGGFQSHLPPRSMAVVTKIRQDFAESWIFDNLQIGDGKNFYSTLGSSYYMTPAVRTEFASYMPGSAGAMNPDDSIMAASIKLQIHYYIRPLAFGFRPPAPLADSPVSTIAPMFAASTTSASPIDTNTTPQIRKDFAETWIFDNNEITDGNSLKLTKKIPDTITSWVVTGFSLNPKTGLALTADPTKIEVFQPFFVSTNLPYSVKRGEVIAVPVIIFNYMDKDLDAEVVMDNTDKEYDFTEATNEVEENPLDEVKRTKRVSVPSNTGKSVSFMIRPNKVGQITLKITATTPLAGDAIHQTLKVEPEGVTQYENRAVFINLKDNPEFTDNLTVDVPAEAVPDSEYIEFTVVGDILGPTVKNLDKLVRMPYGCGEQNMVNFVPNILVLRYLEAIKRDAPTVVEKAKKYLEIGYQRELTYKHNDGSYSAFGKSDKHGSTWLTAYVMRSFHQAAKYTDIDPKVIEEGLDFLASKQAPNGSFPEYGKLFDSAHQNELGLTAFVLLAFLENVELQAKYIQSIDKGISYLMDNVDQSDDQYSLSIAALALQISNIPNPAAAKVLTKLEGLAKQENEHKWWSKQEEPKGEDKSWYYRRHSNDVEITSYVLLTVLKKDGAENALPIVKWLISQRNSNGGFASTQDTVMGLQALIGFAEKTGSGTGEMNVEFISSGGGETKGTIQVNPENSLVLQTHVLPKTTREVNFTAEGKGSALVQLSYRYNLADKDKKPSFQVKTNVKADKPTLILEVCAEYAPEDVADGEQKESNMVVMEVALPSGYTADTESFEAIGEVDRVKRTETKNSESTVIVYFDSLPTGEVKCIPMQASKTHAVAKQKPAAVNVYDYYDTNRRATEYYQVQSSLCDICEGDDCGEKCLKVKESRNEQEM